MNTSHHHHSVCRLCGSPTCLPLANNALGVEIQEYHEGEGWKGVGAVYKRACKAKQVMDALPDDGIPRRVYTALEPRKGFLE